MDKEMERTADPYIIWYWRSLRLPWWNLLFALMGAPTAAGFHSPLNGALRESQRLRERVKKIRSVMGIHVSDIAYSFIDLQWPWLHWRDGFQGHNNIQGISFSPFTLHFLVVRYFLWLNWFNGVLMGKLHIVDCWSKIPRALLAGIVEVVTLEAESTGHILIHLSRTIIAGEMQQSMSRVTQRASIRQQCVIVMDI